MTRLDLFSSPSSMIHFIAADISIPKQQTLANFAQLRTTYRPSLDTTGTIAKCVSVFTNANLSQDSLASSFCARVSAWIYVNTFCVKIFFQTYPEVQYHPLQSKGCLL